MSAHAKFNTSHGRHLLQPRAGQGCACCWQAVFLPWPLSSRSKPTRPWPSTATHNVWRSGQRRHHLHSHCSNIMSSQVSAALSMGKRAADSSWSAPQLTISMPPRLTAWTMEQCTLAAVACSFGAAQSWQLKQGFYRTRIIVLQARWAGLRLRQRSTAKIVNASGMCSGFLHACVPRAA